MKKKKFKIRLFHYGNDIGFTHLAVDGQTFGLQKWIKMLCKRLEALETAVLFWKGVLETYLRKDKSPDETKLIIEQHQRTLDGETDDITNH